MSDVVRKERAGDVPLGFDPGDRPGDAHLVFIGRVRSAWASPSDCPKNPRAARERGQSAVLEIDAAFRPGLDGLEAFSHVTVLVWLDRTRRDVIGQRPKHLAEGPSRGSFSLRSPVRPNPIGLSTARILSIDRTAGRIEIDAIDFADMTPIVDLKPYLPTIDSIPDARVP